MKYLFLTSYLLTFNVRARFGGLFNFITAYILPNKIERLKLSYL